MAKIMNSMPASEALGREIMSVTVKKRLIDWPKKYEICGVQVSATTYAEVTDLLTRAASLRLPAIVDFTPVSVLTEAATNETFRSRINCFDIACPDGQPVRWCLNHFHGAGVRARVCGTTATLSLCESAARNDIGVYFYGSTPETLARLRDNLLHRCPDLKIVGIESPPFAPLTPAEDAAVVARINGSGAGFVFVGLGSPKQEHFVWEHRSSILAVQLCVGAAFDFIAGTRARAPDWMQAYGFEWLHRVWNEPLRLGKRYAFGNTRFVMLLVAELIRSFHAGTNKRTRSGEAVGVPAEHASE